MHIHHNTLTHIQILHHPQPFLSHLHHKTSQKHNMTKQDKNRTHSHFSQCICARKSGKHTRLHPISKSPGSASMVALNEKQETLDLHWRWGANLDLCDYSALAGNQKSSQQSFILQNHSNKLLNKLPNINISDEYIRESVVYSSSSLYAEVLIIIPLRN